MPQRLEDGGIAVKVFPRKLGKRAIVPYPKGI
jgi:hypothetical protein